MNLTHTALTNVSAHESPPLPSKHPNFFHDEESVDYFVPIVDQRASLENSSLPCSNGTTLSHLGGADHPLIPRTPRPSLSWLDRNG
ncbi:hypothetical protein BDM02DRAFT_3264263 [Thelephora ganbajun]|uniref:Uncharacterized protein n=1 Tax=Thelephora ganbajun TaxID=370292 RepID=A0ACB6YZY8_THEGA|nr:hypothetical protein BDM02DRAFT_3264263 [Thelephora ganbajun]